MLPKFNIWKRLKRSCYADENPKRVDLRLYRNHSVELQRVGYKVYYGYIIYIINYILTFINFISQPESTFPVRTQRFVSMLPAQ